MHVTTSTRQPTSRCSRKGIRAFDANSSARRSHRPRRRAAAGMSREYRFHGKAISAVSSVRRNLRLSLSGIHVGDTWFNSASPTNLVCDSRVIKKYYSQIGNAQAGGQVGSANAWNNALGNIGNTALYGGLYGASRASGVPKPSASDPYGVYGPW